MFYKRRVIYDSRDVYCQHGYVICTIYRDVYNIVLYMIYCLLLNYAFSMISRDNL